MNSEPMLAECLGCNETYLADNLCGGYRCPKCNGYTTERGFIEDLEERVKDLQDKIDKAKENGLIRKYTTSAKTNKCRYGVDYGSGRDITVTVKIDTEQIKKIEDLTKLFDDFSKIKRAGVNE